MQTVFSKRHQRALKSGDLKFSLPRTVRGRLRKATEHFDFSYSYYPDPDDNWSATTTASEQTQLALHRAYGVDHLEALDYETNLKAEAEDLSQFIDGAYPNKVFDAIELFNTELDQDRALDFQGDTNRVFLEEEQPWRLLEGQIVRLDPTLLEQGAIDEAVNQLKTMGLEGALQEFKDALNEVTGGDARDAIQDACNAFESVMKSLTEGKGDAHALISQIAKMGLFDDLPRDTQKPLKKVLQALPILGNELGRHGQGKDVVEVATRYAKLAVRLAGTLILFLLDAKQNMEPPPAVSTTIEIDTPDEAPF
ncbi:MAG TPA: hypothetical protein ENH00_08365 [Actinobacteria bacterium]|nr:hypothetical protein BMS3Bbin01_00382 [bacterium BMS3Bbin01]HDH26189.1 hypothetical protein [Actinomycetota bacterium]